MRLYIYILLDYLNKIKKGIIIYIIQFHITRIKIFFVEICLKKYIQKYTNYFFRFILGKRNQFTLHLLHVEEILK